ncbi:MAG: proton-conducting membrane transporter [Clostridium sp.]|nr:proton-conducting membrane transporter [Clostridium sp.]
MILSPLFLLVPILVSIAGGYGVLLFGFKNERPREIYAEAVTCLTSVLVWIAILNVERGAEAEIYSFTRGFSMALFMDGASMLFAGMVSLMWPMVLLYAFAYLHEARFKNAFFAFYIMTYGITLGIAFASNMTTLYVFYEMLTLVTLPLVVYYGNAESMHAGRIYAAYTIGGASLGFFTLLMTTLYGHGGSFIYGGSLDGTGDYRMLMLAFVFGFFGYGTKAAILPLSKWLPMASVAPTPVTALLHAVAVVNSGAFAVIRMVWYVYGPEMLYGTAEQHICLLTAIVTIVFSAVMALKERHFKRRLAWSTVSNLSYMLFGILLVTPDGLRGGMAHMLFHGIVKMSLFLCAGAFMHVTGDEYIYEINGVGKKMPVTFVLYTLAALSLTGIPLFCGFVSKWQLFTAAAEVGDGWAILGMASLILASLLCAMYTLMITIRAFFPMHGTDWYQDDYIYGDAGIRMLGPLAFFVIANIAFGIWPGPILRFLTMISQGYI